MNEYTCDEIWIWNVFIYLLKKNDYVVYLS